MFSVVVAFALSCKLSTVATSSVLIADNDIMSNVLMYLQQPDRVNLGASKRELRVKTFMKENAAVAELKEMMLNESVTPFDIYDRYVQARGEWQPYLLYFHKLLHSELPDIIKILSHRYRQRPNVQQFISERLSAIGIRDFAMTRSKVRRMGAQAKTIQSARINPVFISTVLCDMFHQLYVNDDPFMVLAAAIYYKNADIWNTSRRYGLQSQAYLQYVILWDESVIASVPQYVKERLQHRTMYDLAPVLSLLAVYNRPETPTFRKMNGALRQMNDERRQFVRESTAEVLLAIIQMISETESVEFYMHTTYHFNFDPEHIYQYVLKTFAYLFHKDRREESMEIIGLLCSFTDFRQTFQHKKERFTSRLCRRAGLGRELTAHVEQEMRRRGFNMDRSWDHFDVQRGITL